MEAISKLNINDFKKTLENETKVGEPRMKGNPLVILTIFGQATRQFYGTYDNKSFELTKNAIMKVVPYLIIGKYKKKSDKTTRLNYEIKPIWFGVIWIRIISWIFLLLFNLLIIMKSETIPIDVLIALNVMMIPAFIIANLIINKRKKKMIKCFINTFELINN